MAARRHDWDQLERRIRDLAEAGHSRREIQSLLDLPRGTLNKALERFGISTKGASGPLSVSPAQAPRRAYVLTESDRAQIAALVRRACIAGNVGRDVLIDSKRRGIYARVRWALLHAVRQRLPQVPMVVAAAALGGRVHSFASQGLASAQALLRRGDAEFVALVDAVLGDGPVLPLWWNERPPRPRNGCEVINLMVAVLPWRKSKGFTAAALDIGQGPRMTVDEIAARREQVQRDREAREAQWLAAERARYGLNRQTRARPLSEQAA